MNDIIQQNKKTYDALAKEYDEKTAIRKNYNAGMFERFSKFIDTGKEILDIGCAVGLDLENFRERGFVPIGVELSGEMANISKERNPGVEILEGDFMELEIPKNFDAVWAQSFIHLYPKVEAQNVLQKIRFCLKDGGVVYLANPKSEESSEGWIEKKDYKGGHRRFRKSWMKEELEEELEKAGFEILEYYETSDSFNKIFMIFILRK